MTTKKELVEFLKTIPDETEIQVIEGYDCGYSTCTKTVPLSLKKYEGNFEYYDFTGNTYVKKGSENYNKKFLTFGEE